VLLWKTSKGRNANNSTFCMMLVAKHSTRPATSLLSLTFLETEGAQKDQMISHGKNALLRVFAFSSGVRQRVLSIFIFNNMPGNGAHNIRTFAMLWCDSKYCRCKCGVLLTLGHRIFLCCHTNASEMPKRLSEELRWIFG
jgi:hypothetical protein